MNTKQQMVAQEINAFPRIVITAKGMLPFPHPKVKMVIPEEQLMSALDLIEFLKGQQRNASEPRRPHQKRTKQTAHAQ